VSQSKKLRNREVVFVPGLPHPDQPCYTIGVVAQLVRLHPQTLRRYEELGLVRPARRSGRRLYSQRDIDRLRQIIRLTDELGVNLAGVEVILRLKEQLLALQAENENMRAKLETVVARLDQPPGASREPSENQYPDLGASSG